MTVLIADDDEDQLAVRAALLRHSGFETMEALNASTALQMAERGKPSCALIDLCLPGEQDGLGLIREIKQRYPTMPVFVLTGRAGYKDVPELQGVDGIFLKGSGIRKIISRLRDGR